VCWYFLVHSASSTTLYDDSSGLLSGYTAICMLIGAIICAAAGYIGMGIATLANTRKL
jgi:Na+/H+-translocating membrane pyrophosphatase